MWRIGRDDATSRTGCVSRRHVAAIAPSSWSARWWGRSGSAAGVAEPALAPLGDGQLVDLDQAGVLDGLEHELRDALAPHDLEVLGRVGVDQQHLELAPIAGVDQAGRVQAGDAVLQCEAAPRLHEA